MVGMADRPPSTAVALFTRDLRVSDNPMLAAAAAAGRVVPLFVVDPVIANGAFTGDNRAGFLAACLRDLDRSLRGLGGRLVVRSGDVVEQVCAVAERVGAGRVHLSADVSGYATRREHRLQQALAAQRRELVLHPEVHTVVPPGRITPSGSDHFAVFTPYWRRWTESPVRPITQTPRRLELPAIAAGRLPAPPRSRSLLPGGESEGLARLRRWLRTGVDGYAHTHDRLADDGTSRLSPYLHLGCLSAAELVRRTGDSVGAQTFVRQLAWRDFHHQVLASRPDVAHRDYRPRGDDWHDDPDGSAAWREGCTGYPIVDAGMRQLLAEGWMHNRARLITAGFLTKLMRIDWRTGAAHYFDHLLDGDLANNCLNWQWVAGTGTDTRPNRVLSPLRQAERYDPDAEYVRRWVPEVADLPARFAHRPWELPEPEFRALGYPARILDYARARASFLAARGTGPDGH